MCKRYGNALFFALPSLKGEVNTVDLMLIEGIRVFYPQVYSLIQENKDCFLGTAQHYSTAKEQMEQIVARAGNAHGTRKQDSTTSPLDSSNRMREQMQKLLASTMGAFGTREQDAITSLLKSLFPNLSILLDGGSHDANRNETWKKEQRVCSPDYFDRYFKYAVLTGEVPDVIITTFLSELQTKTVEQIKELLIEILVKYNEDKVVQKLREREKTINPANSAPLAKAIALAGSHFPNPQRIFFQSARYQAAILVHQLLLNIPEREQRIDLASEIIHTAMPLPFCNECFSEISSNEETPDEKRTVDKSTQKRLGKIIATRIKQEAEQRKNLYTEYMDDANLLARRWALWGDKKEVEAYLIKLFSVDNVNVTRFLASYLPTQWGVTSGIPRKGDFEREQFDSVKSLIDPKNIMDKLSAIFGAELTNPTSRQRQYSAYPPDKKAAFQFADLYHQFYPLTS